MKNTSIVRSDLCLKAMFIRNQKYLEPVTESIRIPFVTFDNALM